MSAFVDDRPEWISPRLIDRASGVQFWGDSRTALNRAAWEVARRINSRFQWLEIGGLDPEGSPDDPAAAGLVPPDQLIRSIPPAELRPDNRLSARSLNEVILPDESDNLMNSLVDFMRLPSRVQEDLRTVPRHNGPGAYVIANADRLFEYYPDDPEMNRRQLAAFRRENVSLIVTVLAPPKRDRFSYDYVFEVSTPHESPWTDSIVTCERRPDGVEPPGSRLIPVASRGGAENH